MKRFIGGHNMISLCKTIDNLHAKHLIPLIDYAKEGSNYKSDVLKYNENLDKLVKNVNSVYMNKHITCGYALKLSSFLPHKPYKSLMQNIHKMSYTHTNSVHIFLDAEKSSMKPIENYIYNKIFTEYTGKSYIYKTYQMYRKDSLQELEKDLYRFRNLNVKLVRGAYHSRYDDSLFQSKKETDDAYNNAINILKSVNNQVCIATHNKRSIEIALDGNNNTTFSFAQLLGMADDISADLVKRGKTVYKYVPYGDPYELYPYLIRRLYENYGTLKHIR